MTTSESEESVILSSNVVKRSCFTPIPPTRRFLHSPSMDLTLCPSMDLMVVGSSSSSSSSQTNDANNNKETNANTATTTTTTTTLVLHRTISPQKLSHKTLETKTTADTSTTGTTTGASSSSCRHRPVTCCWRSDGRVLAVIIEGSGEQQEAATGGGVRGTLRESSSSSLIPSSTSSPSFASLQLYAVEDILKEWQSSPATNTTTLSWNNGTSSTKTTTARSVCSMTWSFVGNPHPSWTTSAEEEERQWSRDHVHFPIHFPPSEYHFGYIYESASLLNTHPSTISNSASTSNMMMRGARPHHHHHHYHELAAPHVLPSQSPLSVLAVLTLDQDEWKNSYHLSVYLHGRYPWIVDLPLAEVAAQQEDEGGEARNHHPAVVSTTANAAAASRTTSESAQVVVSHTLSHVIVSLPNSILLAASIPTTTTLTTRRTKNAYSSYSLAAPAIALDYHLRQLLPKVKEIAAAYSSSLKPLDTKLDALASTLTKYAINIEENDDGAFSSSPVAACLATWMVVGTTNSTTSTSESSSSSLAAAMEQYFSSVQLNDQLLVRLDLSLTVAMANVESQVRQFLLAPSQAVVVQTSELVGLVMSCSSSSKQKQQQQVAAARRVHQRATHLLHLVNQVWSDLVSTRFWLRDILQWLRSTASAVKARGSANNNNAAGTANNPMAQHAAQRRVSDALTQRILTRLQQQQQETTIRSSSNNSKSKSTSAAAACKAKRGRTEHVFGLTTFAKMMTADDDDSGGGLSSSSISIPSTAAALKLELEELLQGPRQQALAETTIQRLTLLPHHTTATNTGQRAAAAMTTRLGAGGGGKSSSGAGGAGDSDCFVPSETAPRDCKEWIVTASYSHNNNHPLQEGAGSGGGDSFSIIDLHAVPLTMNDDDDDSSSSRDHDPSSVSSSNSGTTSCVWLTRLQVGGQSGKKVVDAVFYGDNGKSSLSAMDGGTGQERRQALALLVETDTAAPVQQQPALELWLVVYDDCPFQKVPVQNGRVLLPDDGASTIPLIQVLPLPNSFDGECGYVASEGEGGVMVVHARTRTIAAAVDPDSSARLVLSGSRGVGAVLTKNPPENGNMTTINLYDLEEDGEEEDGMSTGY